MNDFDPLEIIDRLGGLIQSDNRRIAAEHGLQAVHLDVLRYLGRCNRYSNTPAAVAQYLNSTRGTVSQSIKLLEDKGLVSKLADSNDGRVIRLGLRPKGRKLLAKISGGSPLQEALAALPAGELEDFADTAVGILRAAQKINGNRRFGQCRGCRFFQREAAGQYRCGMTSEPLSESDSLRICIEYEPAARSAAQ